MTRVAHRWLSSLWTSIISVRVKQKLTYKLVHCNNDYLSLSYIIALTLAKKSRQTLQMVGLVKLLTCLPPVQNTMF